MRWLAAAVLVSLLPAPRATIAVGSKSFPESRLLGEMFAQLLEDRGYVVERKLWLGGTKICFDALKEGGIGVYPEYTGTLEQAILGLDRRATLELLREKLSAQGLEILSPLGFNNTYALALPEPKAAALGVRSISDLAGRPELRLGLSHEFLNRNDGWPGLKAFYGLPQTPVGLEHGLAYQAIAEGSIDVTDAYSTDGKLVRHRLSLLRDDRGFFPAYLAVPLVRAGLESGAKRAIDLLAGRLDESRMSALNAAVEVDREDFAPVAQRFLAAEGLLIGARVNRTEEFWPALGRRTLRHLLLTLGAVAAAVFVAVPLGVFVHRWGRAGTPVLYAAGILQTLPSIALLALLIPVLGIGVRPAMAALFLYALLPILRNTAGALTSIDPLLKDVATGMGLTRGQRLRHVELPLALPMILAGVRTSTVISIGTATLAAFIGAGGLGESIVTGLDLNRTDLILQGAIPAIVLALAAEIGFEALDRVALPAHLRQATRPGAGPR